MKRTLQQAKQMVRNVGLRLKYNRDLNEYAVVLPCQRGDEKVFYYTDDREDAVQTAFRMAVHYHIAKAKKGQTAQ